MAEQSHAQVAVVEVGGERRREYRKGNWTLNETMVLIAARKMNDERRMKREIGEYEGRIRTTELKWKWVEDYCWSNGCMRSQNQCNDKWDNLMRDYKKVRDHEMRLEEKGEGGSSYWQLERHERKERNLPSNLLPEIYEALVDVVERRGPQRVRALASNKTAVIDRPMSSNDPPSSVPLLLQHQTSNPTPPPLVTHGQVLPTLDSAESEHSGSSTKRRRRQEGSRSSDTTHELEAAISKSASILAEAFLACDEKAEKRHRDFLNLEERKLKNEESKAEISGQSINGLCAAINKLSNSIFASVSPKSPTAPKSSKE